MTVPYRAEAGDVLHEMGFQRWWVDQNGRKGECTQFVIDRVLPKRWLDFVKPIIRKAAPPSSTPAETNLNLFSITPDVPETMAVVVVPEEIQETAPDAVNTPLPVTNVQGEAVNPPLPPTKAKKNHKGTMPNGRTAKGVPEFKNWFCRFFPADITYPAWKYLSKTATDVANICRAKRDHAAARNHKDDHGVPIFEFTFSEASNFFKISRPTFDKAVKQLLEVGFIEYASRGGILNGRGIPAQYRLCDRWKEWEPSQAKAKNREKLSGLTQKQNPSKPVLLREVNPPLLGKGKTK